MKRMPGKLSEQGTAPGSSPANNTSEGFISNCLQVLDSTTAGTAIYILSCLCPEDFNVILGLVRLDLSRPHRHEYPPEKRVHLISSSYADVISRLKAYANTIPANVYGRVWLEVAQRWLLTCPIDPDYYQSDETGKDLFCCRLRSELLDRILNIT